MKVNNVLTQAEAVMDTSTEYFNKRTGKHQKKKTINKARGNGNTKLGIDSWGIGTSGYNKTKHGENQNILSAVNSWAKCKC